MVTTKLIRVFVFAYADCWFSHEDAHLFTAGKEWGEMTNEAKLPYEKQSQEEQRKYDIAMAEWRKVGSYRNSLDKLKFHV